MPRVHVSQQRQAACAPQRQGSPSSLPPPQPSHQHQISKGRAHEAACRWGWARLGQQRPPHPGSLLLLAPEGWAVRAEVGRCPAQQVAAFGGHRQARAALQGRLPDGWPLRKSRRHGHRQTSPAGLLLCKRACELVTRCSAISASCSACITLVCRKLIQTRPSGCAEIRHCAASAGAIVDVQQADARALLLAFD